ncbi:hypothetical protein BT96DRAFT_1026101 [Gymnopus androsaceus JB14]|uniref:Uncharacterized protein n=1 Tax=Gymnopus androsaceus JB14 TaxID=1447944 RepID=A0A6A4GN84_9AGAR|nr:hypothetical protein BT96DRAFT_1026101 [Gymnopus androsaceus JB14]
MQVLSLIIVFDLSSNIAKRSSVSTPSLLRIFKWRKHAKKIELFRNYYLGGTLSFHFRPTPHPFSVRRRIKAAQGLHFRHLDWISYALIDDITDAFGPLIQSIEYEVDSIDELVLILKDSAEQRPSDHHDPIIEPLRKDPLPIAFQLPGQISIEMTEANNQINDVLSKLTALGTVSFL